MIATFGHSTLDETAAMRMLDAGGVDVLIDVRSHPTSHFRQWRREHLARWVPRLSAGTVAYQWWPELGGWDVRHAEQPALVKAMALFGVDLPAYGSGAFPKQRIARVHKPDPADPNGSRFTNLGLHDYGWFTSMKEFNDGLDRLVEMFGSSDAPCAALMCAEAVPWRCHRSMIADVLTARGCEVRHLPRWDSHASWSTIEDRIGRYPEPVRASWSGCTPKAAQLGKADH